MAEIGSLAVRLGLDNKDFKKGLKDSKQEVQGFNNNLKDLAGAIGIAFGISELAQFTKELYLLNETAFGVTKTFQTFNNSKRLMDDLKTATGDTVGELALMQQAINARNFNIPISELAKLLKFATIRAAETGQSVDYLVNSLVVGIGRKSVLVLDNLGISSIAVQEEFKRTGDFAKAVSNIIDENLTHSALTIDEAAKSSAKLASEWEDFKLLLSDFTKKEGAEFVTFLHESLIAARQLVKFFKSEEPEQWTGLNKMAKEWSEAQAQIEADAKAITDEINNFFLSIGASENVIDTLGEVNTRLDELEKLQLDATRSELAGINQEIERMNALAKELKNIGLGTSTPKFTGSAVQGQGFTPSEVAKPTIDPTKIEGVNTALSQTDVWGNQLAMTFSNVQDVFVNLNNVMTQFTSATLTGFAEDIGNALSGVGSFGDGILSAMSGFMGAFGKQLIALGVAKMGLDQLFKAGPVGAAIAIGAGVALVAASQALSNSAASSVAAIGSGGGGFSGSSGATRGLSTANQSRDQTIHIVGRMSGRDIVFGIDKTRERKKRGG